MNKIVSWLELSPDFSLPNKPLYSTPTRKTSTCSWAFPNGKKTCLVMIEAKGATSWSNKQLRSKANRLKVIFDPDPDWARHDVDPYFVIASPKQPNNLKLEEWFPEFMMREGRLVWMPLPLPDTTARIERCDPDTLKPNKNASTWHVLFEHHQP